MSKLMKVKKNLFLLELMISIALFMLLLIVGLLFFIKAHKLTIKTSELHEAVNVCSNIAALYESGDGSLSTISEEYNEKIIMPDQLVIYLDDNYEECPSGQSSFYVTISNVTTENRLSTVEIAFHNSEQEVLYTLQAYHYSPLTIREGR